MLSASKILHDRNNYVTGTKDKLELKRGSARLEMTRDPSLGLWFFQGTRARILEVNTTVDTTSPVEDEKMCLTNDINTAHDRLAHTSESTLQETMKAYGMKLTGKLNACNECLQVRVMAKGFPKTTNTVASEPGERLYVDTSGLYDKTINNIQYWMKIL
jgi:hypothetical protein